MVPGPGGPTNEDRTVNNSDDDLRQAIALFRYGVIADLVHLPLGTRRASATSCATRPASPTPSPEATGPTRRRRNHPGVDQALPLRRLRGPLPQAAHRRGDSPGRLPPEVAERLIALKVDNPAPGRCAPSSRLPERAASITRSPPRPCIGSSAAGACSTRSPLTAPTAAASPSATPASCG